MQQQRKRKINLFDFLYNNNNKAEAVKIFILKLLLHISYFDLFNKKKIFFSDCNLTKYKI